MTKKELLKRLNNHYIEIDKDNFDEINNKLGKLGYEKLNNPPYNKIIIIHTTEWDNKTMVLKTASKTYCDKQKYIPLKSYKFFQLIDIYENSFKDSTSESWYVEATEENINAIKLWFMRNKNKVEDNASGYAFDINTLYGIYNNKLIGISGNSWFSKANNAKKISTEEFYAKANIINEEGKPLRAFKINEWYKFDNQIWRISSVKVKQGYRDLYYYTYITFDKTIEYDEIINKKKIFADSIREFELEYISHLEINQMINSYPLTPDEAYKKPAIGNAFNSDKHFYIKINNKNEWEDAQQILFELGYEWVNGKKYHSYNVSIEAISINFLEKNNTLNYCIGRLGDSPIYSIQNLKEYYHSTFPYSKLKGFDIYANKTAHNYSMSNYINEITTENPTRIKLPEKSPLKEKNNISLRNKKIFHINLKK